MKPIIKYSKAEAEEIAGARRRVMAKHEERRRESKRDPPKDEGIWIPSVYEAKEKKIHLLEDQAHVSYDNVVGTVVDPRTGKVVAYEQGKSFSHVGRATDVNNMKEFTLRFKNGETEKIFATNLRNARLLAKKKGLNGKVEGDPKGAGKNEKNDYGEIEIPEGDMSAGNYTVERLPYGSIDVKRGGKSVMYLQGQDASDIERDASGGSDEATDRQIIEYLDSAGALQH